MVVDEFLDQNWDEQPMGVILMVELRATLDKADGWTLQPWTEQVKSRGALYVSLCSLI